MWVVNYCKEIKKKQNNKVKVAFGGAIIKLLDQQGLCEKVMF